MSQLLHLRVGRFFEASALSRAHGLATTLETTARLDELAHRSCRAIEWFSATEAWCDLGTGRAGLSPWTIADRLHHEINAALAVEVACGVATTRRAARAASAMASPSGLVVVLPGYESAVIQIARKARLIDGIDPAIDATPLRPALVPRAIVRGIDVDAVDDDTRAAAVAALVGDARAGLDALGVLAATVRLQFTDRTATREAMASLPFPTSSGVHLRETAERLGRRLGACAGPGRLSLSLSQLRVGPAQGTLFDSRYDRHGQAARRRA